MKYFLYKIVFLLIVLPVYLTANITCLSPYKCEIKGKKINGVFVPERARNCKVPTMPNMPITPVDIFDVNGELKYYFGTGKTVCDVLGWMNEGAVNISEVTGMNIDIDSSIDLIIGHLEGSPGGDTRGGLRLDSDPFLGYGKQPPGSSIVPDGNKFATTIHHTTVHEFFHIAQHAVEDNYDTPDGTPWV